MQAQILTFIIPGVMAILAAILLGLWWQDRSRIHALTSAVWALSFCAGIVFQGVIRLNFAPYDILVFHLNAAGALIIMFWGLGKRDKNPAPVLPMVAVTAITFPILYFARIYENQAVLVMAQNFNVGMLFALSAQAKTRIAARNWADRVIVWVFMLVAGYSIIRPSMTLLVQSQLSVAEYQASFFASLNIVLSALLALMVALTLIAIVILDKMQQQVEGAAIDPLSGLPTRAAFEKTAKEMLERARLENRPVSVIVSDIDHFKRVNDTYGHSAGDRVIESFGRLFAEKIRPTDSAGRIGGEEFCLIVWDCKAEDASALADRIRRAALEMRAPRGQQDVSVSASFGVAQWRPAESYAQLFERADMALYEAKDCGRNTVRVSDKETVRMPRQVAEIGEPAPFGNVFVLER